MVRLEDLTENYEEVCEDIRTEVSKFGQVLEIFIPRDGKFVGSVYLEFPTVAEAKVVRKNLNGLSFNGKGLDISFIPFEKFKERELDIGTDLQIIINA